MSTAIARVYTPEGFVIAADGRQANNITKEVVNDSVRKIFSIQHQTRQLAYAIAGPIAFGDFAFPIEFAKATDTLKDSRAKSLWHFSKTLADILSSKLSVTKRAYSESGANPSTDRDREAITFIFLDGYYEGRPKRATITFRHHGAGLTETDEEISGDELYSGHDYGSGTMLTLLANEDASLSAYRPTQKRIGMTLHEGIEVAHNRIRAHCDPIAMTIDPEHCWAMGGHIHIATVTFADGFNWVPGFMPAVQPDPKRDP